MAGEDLDLPPASDDPDAQSFMEMRWKDAARAAREGMDRMRAIWPELAEHMPETAERACKRALEDFESSYRNLLQAGPHVLGQERYDEYITLQTQRHTNT